MASERTTLSSQNPRIAHLRRLSGRRRARSEHRQYIVEGLNLVVEALDAGVVINSIYVDLLAPDTEVIDALLIRAHERGLEVHWLQPGVLNKVADTVSPQPVLAVVDGGPEVLDEWLVGAPSGLVLVLAGVADPGNAGTLVRTAEAVGASAVLFVDDAVDPFSPKTVRSSAGSVMRVPVVAGGAVSEVVAALRSEHFRIVGTAMDDALAYTAADLTGDVAVVLGNEAHGLDRSSDVRFDLLVAIPMLGQVESLNVAVAGSLVAFESARQRALGSPRTAVPGDAAL